MDLKSQEATLEKVSVEMSGEDTDTGFLTSDKGILFLTERPDEGISENDFRLSGNVQFERGNIALSMPIVQYRRKETEKPFSTEGGSFKMVYKTQSGIIRSTGKRLEATKTLSKIWAYGPGQTWTSSESALPAPEAKQN